MTSTTEGNDPDGFVVIHHPADGSDPYGVGPFPWVDELARALIEEGTCRCRREILNIAFPKGIAVSLMGVDLTSPAMEVLAAIVIAFEEGEPDDRLN